MKEQKAEKSTRILRIIQIASVALLAAFFVSNSRAATGYGKLVAGGKEKIKVIERIGKSYPLFNSRDNYLAGIRAEWKKHRSEYEAADSRGRNAVVKKLRVTNAKLDAYLKELCVTLRQYGNDIMSDFTVRIDDDRNAHIKREKYYNNVRVSKQEFHRAARAFRQRNYRFSAHLYDRGIIIMKKTYKQLGWGLPTAYSKSHSKRALSSQASKGL